MMRCALLVLVACSTPSTPDASSADPIPTVPAKPAAGAAHASAIELVAVSDDGNAAVSQDGAGGTRLWPALDGTREPIAVPLVPAVQLVIGRHGDGFVIGARDEGAGLEIVHVGAHGAVISRTRIPPEPPIESIAITAHGVLALGADQAIAILDPRGDIVTRLAAPAGTRIHAVVTRRDHVVALLERDGAMRARRLDGTGWGAELSLDVELTRELALSPSGTRLLARHSGAIVMVDLASGQRVFNVGFGDVIGFRDDDTLVMRDGAKIAWRDARDKLAAAHEVPGEWSGALAIGDGALVGVRSGSLVLHERERVRYLGYRVNRRNHLHVLGDELVVTSGDQRPIVLDRELVQREALQLPDDLRMLFDVQPIDDRFVIASHTVGTSSWWSVSVLDLDEQKTHQTVPHALARGEIRYEPSTRLMAISDHAAAYLTRWDGQSFTTWYRIAGGAAELHLVDPLHNRGIVALAVRIGATGLDVGEIHGDDLKVGNAIEPRRTYRIAGTRPAAFDALGRVYAIVQGRLEVTHRGHDVLVIPDVANVQVAPHPSGAYIAVYGDARIRLYDSAGAEIWQIAAPLARRVAWLGEGVVVDFEGGIGKIDAATGALNQRACGWSFGLGALPPHDQRDEASICDAL
jgi:hypothetical protein